MVTKDTWLKFMQNKVLNRLVTWFILPVGVVVLAYLLVDSISQPVKFNKEKAAREQVGIERLKDIRTLQDAYKSVHGKYTDSFDSLKTFYPAVHRQGESFPVPKGRWEYREGLRTLEARLLCPHDGTNLFPRRRARIGIGRKVVYRDGHPGICRN